MRRSKRRDPAGKAELNGYVKNQVTKLMDNRHRLLAPFPFTAAEVHALFFSVDETIAIQRLEHRGLINTSSWFYIDGVKVAGVNNSDTIVRKVTFHCDNLPMPSNNTLSMALLPPDMKREIAEWGQKWYRLQSETNRVTVKVESLARHCKTFGQIVRVWPEMQGFLGEHARHAVDNARVKSRYPEGVMEWRRGDDGIPHTSLSEEWQPKALEEYNLYLAEALMLPYSDGKHVATMTV